jgi:uncharacterized membrane protein YesL
MKSVGIFYGHWYTVYYMYVHTYTRHFQTQVRNFVSMSENMYPGMRILTQV